MSGGSSKQVPETREEKTLAYIAADRYLRWKKDFLPVENEAIARTENQYENPSGFLPGLANLSTQDQFSKGQNQLVGAMENRGARAGSGAFGMNLAGFNIERAGSSGGGQVGALGIRSQQNLGNMQSLVQMGQGQSGAALTGQGDVAGLASRQAIIDTQASLAARGALGGGLGTAAGLALGNQNFNNSYGIGAG